MSKILISNLKKRHKSEKRFVLFGKISIGFSISFLVFLLSMIIFKGYGAFLRTKIALEINPELITNNQDLRPAIKDALKKLNPQLSSLEDLNSLYQIVSKVANLELKKQITKQPAKHYWLSASSRVDMFVKHNHHESLNQTQLNIIKTLIEQNRIKTFFNWDFFKFGDSREPEIAGIRASFVGSLLVMLVFLACAFPIAVMCAFYLEEFAPKNRLTDIIEVSINNLAGIPSIIYGLLGLTVYLQTLHLPRSSSLVGGLTLFMLVLPVIIIATRNTIRSIPNSIRDGALAIGASKMQLIWHHLLPLSVPGIMTGTILAISRALGETAPLLMIGMVAFIADVPQNFSDPSSALAVQIYLWSDLPETGFVEKTSGAIIILLAFLITLNLSAIILRKKFEKKW
ncbi:MAG: phosphate ABC transporter permease PstA [Alphaproteobacteria bacterium]|nr:phosphate ABC transporter permease PstA [Alphaproteobacteria bacterium]